MKKIIKPKAPLKKKAIIKKNKRNNLRNKNKNKKIKILEQNFSFEEETIENSSEDNKYIKSLIRTIFNLREARRQLKFLGIDIKSFPSSFNDELFKSCCIILNQIDKIINSEEMNHKSKKDKFFQLTKEYYRLIPHIFPFPEYNIYIINDIEKIKREICLLELTKSYFELENAFQKIKNNIEENDNNSMNLNDSNINLSVNNAENLPEEPHGTISNFFFEKALSEFDFTISYIKKDSEKYEEIENYVNSFSTLKGGPYPPLVLLQLFKISKKGEKIDQGNLLWYGCEIPHFYSILKNGLRLPFKEAPKNAFDYGKGILLSDNPYRQIQKCLPKNSIVYLFICNVAFIKQKRVHLHHKNYPEKLKKEFNSVSIRHKITLPNNDKSDINYSNEDDYTNSYDLIFYDTSLVKLCYIVKLQIP